MLSAKSGARGLWLRGALFRFVALALITLAVAAALSPGDVRADHGDLDNKSAAGKESSLKDEPYPGDLPEAGWDAKGKKEFFVGLEENKVDETCAYEHYHSNHVNGMNYSAHTSIELLNEDLPAHDADRPIERLGNGGVAVQPIFNCLPNFWGWVLYKKDPTNPQLATVEDNDKKGQIVYGPWSEDPKVWTDPNTKNVYALPNPQLSRGGKTYFSDNTRSGTYGINLFTRKLGSDQAPPNIHPDNMVFRYLDTWTNGYGALERFQDFLSTAPGFGSVDEASGASVDPSDELFVKIWTAEAIITHSDPSAGKYPSPAGAMSNVEYKHLRIWPHNDNPAAPVGIPAGEYTQVSLLRQVLGALHPVVWLTRFAGYGARATVTLTCSAWEMAANVSGSGCRRYSKSFVTSNDGSDWALSTGELNEGQPMNLMPVGSSSGEPEVSKFRGPAPRWIDDDRAVYITRDMSLAESDLDAFVATLDGLDYDIGVGGPARGPPQRPATQATDSWPRGAPLIASIDISPPSGWTSFIEGETLYIRVRFSKDVYFRPWEIDPSGIPEDERSKYEKAASFQTLENLRLRLAGIYCRSVGEGLGRTLSRAEARDLLSARYDIDSSATSDRGTRTWQFVYKIPKGCGTLYKDGSASESLTYLGVAMHNDLSNDELRWEQLLGTGSNSVSVNDTYVGQCFAERHPDDCEDATPFWFYFDGSETETPESVELNKYFRVGASFTGADGALPDEGAAPFEIGRTLGLEDRKKYDTPDLRFKRGVIFPDHNTISRHTRATIDEWRVTTRSILSFSGLIKGTPSSATYELGYVAYGWTVMMNLVFALFVSCSSAGLGFRRW